MKLATLACLSVLCLNGAVALAAPGDPAVKADGPVAAEQNGVSPKPVQAKPDAPAPRSEARAEPARGEKPATGRDRRRPSYAACNRASHQRGYRGGRRRRFLIRCRLGYERPRATQSQHQSPAAPVRKP